MSLGKGHQRAHLRAPYREPILYATDGYVHSTHCLNISEGGLLLSSVPILPTEAESPLMLLIPNMPLFKNFDLLKLRSWSPDLLVSKVIRLRGRFIRREGKSAVDEVFQDKVGLHFTTIAAAEARLIDDYVAAFAGNLVHLQTLLDSWNTSEEIRAKAWRLAQLLGYGGFDKVSLLRSQCASDYMSLQWI